MNQFELRLLLFQSGVSGTSGRSGRRQRKERVCHGEVRACGTPWPSSWIVTPSFRQLGGDK
jgi:hypothetical protein